MAAGKKNSFVCFGFESTTTNNTKHTNESPAKTAWLG